MKNPWDWDENDLLDMVKVEKKESIELDFKASDSLANTDPKKKEISKDVSAFANSAGGTLIYGMVEDKDLHIAKYIDSGSDPTITSGEWIEQVINSNIQRKIDGIRIKQVELAITSPGRVAYIIYIPASTRAPHQASDKRFYKRFNFQSVPMEEYEIRDVSRRGETPDLRMEFTLIKPPNYSQGAPALEPFNIEALIMNDALEPANYAIIELYIDTRLDIINRTDFLVANQPINQGELKVKEDKTHPVNVIRSNWGVGSKLPIFHVKLNALGSFIMLKAPTPVPGKKYNYILGYQI